MFRRSAPPKEGSRSIFSRFTRQRLPTAPAEERPAEASRPAPTYAHADKQKGPVDKTAEDRDKEDAAIRAEEGKDKNDPEQPVTEMAVQRKTAVGSEIRDGPSTSTAPRQTGNFQKFWHLELDHDMIEVVNSTTNYYTPNALAILTVLQESAQFVFDNNVVIKRHQDYLDYAVVCYYSILFYIQILRAQHAAGKLRGIDRSFLNRFKDKFKFEELPIAAIMEPLFSAIVSTQPMDTKFDWICPDYAQDLIHFVAHMSAAFEPNTGGCFIQPMVPFMLRILKTAIGQTQVTAAQATPANYFDARDRYTTRLPHAAAAVTIFGQQFQQNAAAANDNNVLFSSCGINHPFFADLNTLTITAPRFRRSKFNDYPYGAIAQDNNVVANAATVTNALDGFLNMSKSEDTDWFYELIRQATLHARFFGKETSLSAIPTVSGNEILIGTKLRQRNPANANEWAADHANPQLGKRAAAADVPRWYPNDFNNLYGSFYTTRAGTSREEALQALAFATNASLPVAHPAIAAYRNVAGRVGDYGVFLRGPYWLNKEWTMTLYNNTGGVGKPMFKGWETMIQSKFAVEKPAGY